MKMVGLSEAVQSWIWNFFPLDIVTVRPTVSLPDRIGSTRVM